VVERTSAVLISKMSLLRWGWSLAIEPLEC
jgi:hypothetical protein